MLDYYDLAKSMSEKLKWQVKEKDLLDAVDLCEQKEEKFDPKKGKELNFFSTIIACYLNQVRWRERKEIC